MSVHSTPRRLTQTGQPPAFGDHEQQSHKGTRLEGNLRQLHQIDCGSTVMCCRFSPDGTVVAAGLYDGSIKIFSSDNGQHLHTLSDASDTKKVPVTMVRFRPSNMAFPTDEKADYKQILLASYVSGKVRYWHYPTKTCLFTINDTDEPYADSVDPLLVLGRQRPGSGPAGSRDSPRSLTLDQRRQTLAISVCPDGSKFLTAGTDAVIKLYDEHTRKCIGNREASENRDVMNGHRSRIFALQYHPQLPYMFVSAGWDDTVQFWDDRQAHAIRKIAGPHVCGDALDIDPVHNHLLTGSWRKDEQLQIWDFNSGEKIKDVPCDHHSASQLYCAQWLGKDSIICAGSDFNLARVIDRGTLNNTGMLVDLPQAVYAVDNDRQGSSPRIAIGAHKMLHITRIEKKT